MKMIQKTMTKFVTVLVFILLSFTAIAQDKGTDINVDINKGNSDNWYTQPWLWIIGGAVFILLLVALLRNNRSKE